MTTERLYRHTGFVLVRASTDPGGLEPPEDLDLNDDEALFSSGLPWLADLWRRSEVQTAFRIASPTLSHQIDMVLANDEVDARRLRRLIVSTCAYVLRWQRRSTPFGLFAGIATASIGATPFVRFGQLHQLAMRADAEWLGSVVDGLERNRDLLWRLPVVVNNAGFVRGDRFVVPVRPDDTALSRGASLEMSIRLTRPLRAVLTGAEHPIGTGELANDLSVTFSTVSAEMVEGLLIDLVERRVLITSLRPPMTAADGVDYLVDQLERVGGASMPDVADLLKEITAIRDDLTDRPGMFTAAAEAVGERMASLSSAVTNPLAVDAAVDCDVTVPESIMREAEIAASVLLRLTPHPFGTPAWKDLHVRFRDRYGAGAVVPVRDVVADSGLGYPAGFLDAPRGHAARALTERDATLLARLQEAALDGRDEIELTEPIIRKLKVGDHIEMVSPARVELAFQVHATSVDAIAHGHFQLWVTGAPRPASSMVGRFAHLLTQADQQRLAESYMATSDEALVAQLSFPPRREHNENIARVPKLLPHLISLSEHRATGTDLIDLNDLAVTADAIQLYLVRISTGDHVLPHVLHALEASVQTPPLARFLAEVASARRGLYGSFDFGAARTLPFLPSVRYARTVMSPARWLLDAADLRNAPTWTAGLQRWRERWRVPADVVVCEGELRLPLDLDKQLHRDLLRVRLTRARRVELRATAGQPDLGWAGRPCELLVPLTRISRGNDRPKVEPAITVGRTDAQLPGYSSIVHAQLFGHPARFNEVLIDRLPLLLDGTADCLRGWWFRRQNDTTRPDSDHHIALYLRLAQPQDDGVVATRLAEWAANLSTAGLIAHLNLATYQPQYGRYGHGTAMSAAEDVFTADSAAALAQISMADRTGTPAQVLAAASMVDLAVGLTGHARTGCRWLIDTLPREHAELDRTVRDMAMRIADPTDGHVVLLDYDGGEAVVTAWNRRLTALNTYRDKHEPSDVLRTLLHDHHVRAVGVAPDRERVTNRLARAAAQRFVHRGSE